MRTCMMKTVTKKYKTRKTIFSILSILCLIGPLLFFIIQGFAGAAVVGKLVLSLTSLGAIILAGISVLFKYHLRSPIFLCLMGLWVALESLLPAIICISIAVILDEFIFSPLKAKYKQLYIINKEIDKR